MNSPSTHYEENNVRLDVNSNTNQANQANSIGGLADVALDYFGATNETAYIQNPQVEINGVFTQGIPMADGMRNPLPIYQSNHDNQGRIPVKDSCNLNTYLYDDSNADVMNNSDITPTPFIVSHDSVNRPGDDLSYSNPQKIHTTIPTTGMVSQDTTSEHSKSVPKFRLKRPAPLDMSLIREHNPFEPGETTPQISSSLILDKSTPNQILFENVCKFFTDTPTVWFGSNNLSSMYETSVNRENANLPSTNPPHEKTNDALHSMDLDRTLSSSPPVSFEEVVRNNSHSSDPLCQQAFVKQLTNMPLKNPDSVKDTSSLPEMGVNTSSLHGSHTEEIQTVEKTYRVKPPKVNARKKAVSKSNGTFNDLVKSCLHHNFPKSPQLHHWFVLKIHEHGLSISDFLVLNEELIILNSKIDKGLLAMPYGPKDLSLLNSRKQVLTYRIMKEKMLFLVNPTIHPKKCYKSDCFYSIIGFKSDKELSIHVFHFHFEQFYPCSKCREMYHTRESRDKHFSICHNSNEGEIDISKEYMLAKWGQKDQDTLRFAETEFLRQYRVLRRLDSSKAQLQRHRKQSKASFPKQKTLSSSSQDKLKKQLTQL